MPFARSKELHKKSLPLAEVERSHMGKIERGEHMPTLALILKISSALGISAAELMGATERNLRTDTETSGGV